MSETHQPTEGMMMDTDWYIRDDEGRITGHRDTCAFANCAEKHLPGDVYCSEHEEGARVAFAADRYGWGCPA